MNYNDYPILSDLDYSIINEQFKSNSQFDRKKDLFQICTQIHHCINICNGIEPKYNQRIQHSIKTCISTLSKILSNLSSIFNINIHTNNIYNFNIFSFLKNLVLTSQQIANWQQHETKEYFKTISINSLNEILNIIEIVIKSIEESNYIIFKHM